MHAARRLPTRVLAGLSAAVVSVLVLPAQVLATTAPAKAGITVAPAHIVLQIAKGQQQQEATVGVRNDYAQAVSFDVTIQGLQQNAKGILVPTGTPDAAIAALMTVSPQRFTLEPGKSVNLKLLLHDTEQLSPGGHYAALFIRQAGAEGQKLSLAAAVSVSMFIIKEEGAVRSVAVTSVRHDGMLFRLPRTVTVGFKNEGNVSVVPRAAVTMSGPTRPVLATAAMNQESLWAVAGGATTIQAGLQQHSMAWLPGSYTLNVVYRYDGSDAQHVASVRFWVVPLPFVGVMFLAGVAIIGLVRYRRSILRLLRSKVRRKNSRPTHAVSPSHKPKTMDIVVSSAARPLPRRPARAGVQSKAPPVDKSPHEHIEKL